jgi:hypothetical protein
MPHAFDLTWHRWATAVLKKQRCVVVGWPKTVLLERAPIFVGLLHAHQHIDHP